MGWVEQSRAGFPRHTRQAGGLLVLLTHRGLPRNGAGKHPMRLAAAPQQVQLITCPPPARSHLARTGSRCGPAW